MRSEPRRASGGRGVYSLIRNDLRQMSGERWFRGGLLLRVVLLVVLVPLVQEQWFLPFLSRFLRTLSPYSDWLASGGDPVAWPYGPAMTLAHLPTMLAGLAHAPVWLLHLTFGGVLLAADIATVMALRQLMPDDPRSLAARIWWLSPAALVITYWHGQTDLIPLALLMGALVAFRLRRWSLAGIVAALSVTAKLTLAFAPLFFAVWLGLTRRYAGKLREVFLPLVAIPLAGYGLLLLSPAAREMIFGSPVLGQAASASINLHGTPIMILPALLIAMLYVAARARRLGFDLMLGLVGTALFGMAAVLAVAPGWWLGALPFLAIYAARSDRAEVRWGVWLFSGLLAVQTLMNATGARVIFLTLPDITLPLKAQSVALTLVVSVGLVLAISMFRHTLADNDPYGLAHRPLLIGIAGPSGSGKDTLSAALAGVFGEREVVAVSGDDYHKWERGAPMWRIWTHLNPAANDLNAFTDDVVALTAGRSIKCRYYDHGSGRFEPRRSKRHNNVVLVSGLHTLFGQELRDRLDVRIYLDMDEGLRRFLKLGRDTVERHHSREDVLRSMERRVPDLARYIDPQMAHADLVLRLEPREPEMLEHLVYGSPVPLRLRARIRSGVRAEELRRLLSVFSWCEVSVDKVDGSGETLFMMEAEDLTPADIAEMARLLVPHHDELLALEPRFEGGVSGVMQLLVLMQLGVVRHRSVGGVRT